MYVGHENSATGGKRLPGQPSQESLEPPDSISDVNPRGNTRNLWRTFNTEERDMSHEEEPHRRGILAGLIAKLKCFGPQSLFRMENVMLTELAITYCQFLLLILGLLVFIAGSFVTAASYLGLNEYANQGSYIASFTLTGYARLLGPLCFVVGLLTIGFGLSILIKDAQEVEQEHHQIGFHCPLHGDFYPFNSIRGSNILGRRSDIWSKVFYFSNRSNNGSDNRQSNERMIDALYVNSNRPPICPHSMTSSASSSQPTICPSPMPFLATSDSDGDSKLLTLYPIKSGSSRAQRSAGYNLSANSASNPARSDRTEMVLLPVSSRTPTPPPNYRITPVTKRSELAILSTFQTARQPKLNIMPPLEVQPKNQESANNKSVKLELPIEEEFPLLAIAPYLFKRCVVKAKA